MGREATAIVHWRGAAAEVKLLLEASELILRGSISGRIPRSSISEIRTGPGVLELTAAGAPLRIEMTARQANGWARALAAAPPTLRQKLGIEAGRRAYVVGLVEDEAVATALAGVTTIELAEAAMILGMVRHEADLRSLLTVAHAAPSLPLWCVYGKGKHAALGETAIRRALRSQGYMDTKSSGVSDQLTATRYVRKPGTAS